MKISKKNKYLLTYTCLFVAIAIFFYSFYFKQGKALFNLEGDGYRQCYRAIIYYQKYLKEIINNIFVNHSFVIPQWDFTLGEGSDIIQTLNYYIVGDPFALFCIFVPYDYLYLYIDIASFARLYCAGLTFGYLCFYLKKDNWLAILIGSLSYCFCFYAINYAIEFPFMLNYMVFMPLIIWGIEKIINENKYLLLVISVFLSASSSLPFFYMIVIFTVIYCLIRAIFIKKFIKEKVILTIKITLCSLLGVGLASTVFIPSLLKLLQNSRITREYAMPNLFNFDVLKNSLSLIIIGNHTVDNTIGGVTIPVCLGVISFAINIKNNKKQNILLFILIVLAFCSPLFNKFANGMTYETNRWRGICLFLLSYLFVENYDELLNIKKYWFIYIGIILLYFDYSIYIDQSRLPIQLILLFATLVCVIALSLFKNKYIKSTLLLGVAICCITLNIYNMLSPTLWDYCHKATDVDILNKASDIEVIAANSINDNSFYRYSGNKLVCNESSGGYNPSTNYYWSFPNDDVVNFRTDLGYYDYNLNHYDGYNERSLLNNLASVKYYLVKDSASVPYGFEYLNSNSDYNIYENKNSLSLFYVYTNSISYEDWKKLTILQRQESLLNNVVLDNSNLDTKNTNFTGKEINYEYSVDEGISIDSNKINISNIESSIKLNIDYDGEGEYYLVINNIEFYGMSNTQTYINCSNGVSNTLYHKTKDHFRYAGRNNYAVCLGYLTEPLNDIDITFLYPGEFEFDSIEVYKLEPSNYENELKELKDINIKTLDVETNNIYLQISVDEDKFLCMSIPYTKGWKAYVDGKEVELQKANVMYMGFSITKGEHIIELKYSTPGFKIGICLSAISLVSIVSYYILKKKNKINI